MKKMALFVEGQTERMFAERLLLEIAGVNGLKIDSYSATGGGRSGARSLTRVKVSGASSAVTHFVLIVDCGTDNRVRSDIGDQYDVLVAAGYTEIVGIRDVFPEFTFADIPRFRAGLIYNLKSHPIVVRFVLGVMEVESWFLAEHSHFPRLDQVLTIEKIKTDLGFDPSVDDLQLLPNPAKDLHNAYQLVGRAYRKSRSQVQRTIDLLDYVSLYVDTKTRFPDLTQFIDTVDDFLK